MVIYYGALLPEQDNELERTATLGSVFWKRQTLLKLRLWFWLNCINDLIKCVILVWHLGFC